MIRLYSLYTPSHRELKERFFAPTVPRDVDLRLTYFENEGEGWIHDPSFCRAIVRKCEIIVDAIRDNWGQVFIWSDVDVQFYGPLSDWVPRVTRDLDLVFQIDAPGPCLCTGFFFCRGNDQTLRLWEKALQFVSQPGTREHEQFFMRNHLWYGHHPVRWGHLPPAFIGGGTFTGQCWDPGGDFPVPRDMVMHHANFTAGPKFKVMQFEFVQAKMARGDLISMDDACRRLSNGHVQVEPGQAVSGNNSSPIQRSSRV